MITRNTHSAGSVTASSRPQSGIGNLCRIFYRHKRKMIVAFCSTLALVVVGLIVFPRTYTSEARLFIRLGKENVSLDPTTTTNAVTSLNQTRDSEINSEIEILRSRVLLEEVVQRLGPDEILARDGESGWIDTMLTPVMVAKTWLTPNVSPSEHAVSKLKDAISVDSARKSYIVSVNCKARDPHRAQRILDAFLAAYLAHHGNANRTHGSHDFFVDQSELLSQQLTQANQTLRNAKNRHGIASMDGHKANVQAQASSIEVAMLENERALSSAEAKVVALKKTLGELPEKSLDEESEVPSQAASLMRHELYKVQILEKEASSRYTALHPHVIALRRQVEETRKILASEEAQHSQSTRRLSSVHQAVQIELASTLGMAAALQAEAQTLKPQFKAVQSKIRALNDNELQITDLTRKAELLEASYRHAATGREQSRIDTALAMGSVSNVNVVQPPSFVAKPSSPMVTLSLVLALVLATAASILVALVAEHFDRSLKSAEQVEQELGIPVLFSSPRESRNVLIQN